MDDIRFLKELCQSASLTRTEAARLTGKCDRQWRRYLDGSAQIPGHIFTLLKFKAGDLSLVNPAWYGWILSAKTGALIDPFGRTYSQTWHEGIHWYFEKLAAQRARLRDETRSLKKENIRLKYLLALHEKRSAGCN